MNHHPPSTPPAQAGNLISATVDFSIVEKETSAPHTLSVASPNEPFKGLTEEGTKVGTYPHYSTLFQTTPH